jgi:hypothetical protein
MEIEPNPKLNLSPSPIGKTSQVREAVIIPHQTHIHTRKGTWQIGTKPKQMLPFKNLFYFYNS